MVNEETIKDLKKGFKKTKEFLSNKKVQNAIVIVLLLGIIFLGVYIRLQPLPNLIDQTTGEYIPLALDPFYFLRVSETMVGKGLSEFDEMRYSVLNVPWTNEILPQSTVLLFKISKIFDKDVTLRLANVLNPVIFFTLGILVFFFLILFLTRNKWITLIGSGILVIIPPYLYRTLAGFADHESIGMFGFFLALLAFSWGMFYLEGKKLSYYKSAGIGLVSGLATMFAIASWQGGAKFLLMILPLAFIISWLIKKEKSLWNYILFYSPWVLGIIFFGGTLFSYNMVFLLKAFMLNATGILTLLVLGYCLIETILLKSKIKFPWIKKYSQLSAIIATMILGAIFYEIVAGGFFKMVLSLLNMIIDPFGVGRVGLTVAENKKPYLNEWVSQISSIIFYTFLFGCIIVGGKIAKGIKVKKLRPWFIGTFTLFLFGILFSRISANSALNGDNFISKFFFFVSFIILLVCAIYIYRKSDWEIKTKWIFIVAWMIPMLLSVRSAIRVFFAIVPLVSFMIPWTFFEIGKYAKKSKDTLMKMLVIILLVALVIGLIISASNFLKSVNHQAKNQSPSYNSDWQNAMSWVRNNTAPGSLFIHWWDYGYWVQTGGQRPTVTDGGHFNGYWDHLIGRYVLTTSYPETAKSFMKAHNVSYLLIDPTDIGKYSAYSSIGDDKDISDRASWIITLTSDPKEIQETRNGTTRIYRGGTYLDGDIQYEDDLTKAFLPKGKAALGGIILEKNNQKFKQPEGIYIYNNQQYRLPVRYLYQNGNLIDFGTGINSTVYVYANVYNSGAGQQFDVDGAVMYLSAKTKDSLVAKLYLMNDPEKEYEELKLVHSESPYPFPFYYGGFRGPIKIWEVNEMPNIIARKEFLRAFGEYGEFDDLEFIK